MLTLAPPRRPLLLRPSLAISRHPCPIDCPSRTYASYSQACFRRVASSSLHHPRDVLHDFAVPALGLKIDCCPGRLNQTSALAQRAGTFYGQCSELCGVYHGFMPIVVQAVDLDAYLVWLDSQL